MAQHGDLGEPATACPIARDVQQDLDCRGELAVQSSAVKARRAPLNASMRAGTSTPGGWRGTVLAPPS
ncbi:predicted protein [Mycobacterium tuberculosis T85]|nr:predicted protein [Mycobacterium tuberculosis T85]